MLVLSSLDRKLCHEFRCDVRRLFITRNFQEDRTNFMTFINNASNVGTTWYWTAFACNHCCRGKGINVTYSDSVQNLLSSRLLSKNLKIKIYRAIILPVVLYGCETWSLTLRKERRLRVFGIGCWGKYLDLRGTRWQGNGESCITRSWMISTPYPILCGW